MSIAVEYAPHNLGHYGLADNMPGPHNSWHQESSIPRNGSYYPPEQHMSQPPRLPSMASIISTTTQSHAPNAFSSKSTYYSEYATPSPVGQTPPQFPSASSDPHSMPRRPVADVRLSPAQSSVASDRSDDYLQDMMRMRQGAQIPRPYPPQPSTRRDTFHHQDRPVPQGSFGKLVPGASSYTGPSNVPPPPPRQLHSPPTPQASTSPRQPSMSISALLSDSDPGHRPSRAPTSRGSMRSPTFDTNPGYKIAVRQQPYAARSCGFGERDRRVIDPPPIVQLTAENTDMSPDELMAAVRTPFSVVHCSIWDESGTKDMSSMPEDFRQQRRLMGTLVASPFIALDENGEEGCFFCFPDLSCRTPGTFRLKFAIVVLDLNQKRPGYKAPILSTALSDAFQVFNAKDFPGMKASTALTKKLKDQGCLISIKKGNDKAGAVHGRDDSEDDEEEERYGSKKGRKKHKKH